MVSELNKIIIYSCHRIIQIEVHQLEVLLIVSWPTQIHILALYNIKAR